MIQELKYVLMYISYAVRAFFFHLGLKLRQRSSRLLVFKGFQILLQSIR